MATGICFETFKTNTSCHPGQKIPPSGGWIFYANCDRSGPAHPVLERPERNDPHPSCCRRGELHLRNPRHPEGLQSEKAFNQNIQSRTLCCIDEGVNIKARFRLAGSGVMMSTEEILQIIRENNITKLTTHEDCGAAHIMGEDPIVWAREISARAGIHYDPIHHHITLEQMREREDKFHPARTVIFTPLVFSPHEVNTPLAFNISGMLASMRDLVLAVNIAVGQNGFGKRFLQDRLEIIIIGDPRDPAMSFDKLVIRAMAALESKFGYINISGFDAKESWLK
jgi:hypothetical protein